MEKLFVEDHLAFAASSIYGSGKKPMDKQKVLELAKRYGKNQGYLGYYLRIYSEFGEIGKRMKMQ